MYYYYHYYYYLLHDYACFYILYLGTLFFSLCNAQFSFWLRVCQTNCCLFLLITALNGNYLNITRCLLEK